MRTGNTYPVPLPPSGARAPPAPAAPASNLIGGAGSRFPQKSNQFTGFPLGQRTFSNCVALDQGGGRGNRIQRRMLIQYTLQEHVLRGSGEIREDC